MPRKATLVNALEFGGPGRRGELSIIVLGIGFGTQFVLHEATHGARLDSVLLGAVLPLLVAGSLAYGGYRLRSMGFDESERWQVAIWTYLGAIGMALFAVSIVVYHLVNSHVLAEPISIVIKLSLAGGVAGYGIGFFHAAQRQGFRALSLSQRQYREVFEQSLDGLLLLDGDGAVIDANPTVTDVLGVKREDVVGQPIATFLPEKFDLRSVEQEFLEDGQVSGEIVIQQPAGEERIVEYSMTEELLPEAHLVSLHDVTDHRRDKEQIEREREKLAFLNQVLRHHILNGMNLISAKASLIQDEHNPDSRDELMAIQRRADTIVRLVQKIRRLAEAISDDSEFTPQNLSGTLSRGAMKTAQTYPNAKIVTTGSIPEDVFVTASELLSEVFDNLLMNAVEHNTRDEPTVWVSCEVLDSADAVEVRIADDGPGIPDAQKAAVLEEGESFGGSTGTSFGLHIVQLLVESYDGQLRIDDNEPVGTIFTLRFPLTDPPSSEWAA